VAGDAACEDDFRATPEQLAQMAQLVEQSMEDGALGYSISRSLFHRVPDGRNVPGTWSNPEEFYAIAEPLGRHGALYTAHMRDEGAHILEALDETFEIGKRSGAAVIVSHHKCSGRPNFGRMRETLPKIDAARATQDIAEMAAQQGGFGPAHLLRQGPACGQQFGAASDFGRSAHRFTLSASGPAGHSWVRRKRVRVSSCPVRRRFGFPALQSCRRPVWAPVSYRRPRPFPKSCCRWSIPRASSWWPRRRLTPGPNGW
jgi:hypothetical protein